MFARKVFENLENSGFEEVKSIFEVNVENYKSHIMQTNGNDDITNLLISNIKKGDTKTSNQKMSKLVKIFSTSKGTNLIQNLKRNKVNFIL